MKVIQLLPLRKSKGATSLPGASLEKRKKTMHNQSGQAVIEYVLLLVIVTSLGAIIIRDLVSRNTDQPGILVSKWNDILKTIAKDNPEE